LASIDLTLRFPGLQNERLGRSVWEEQSLPQERRQGQEAGVEVERSRRLRTETFSIYHLRFLILSFGRILGVSPRKLTAEEQKVTSI
jgi:hypothetical protein